MRTLEQHLTMYAGYHRDRRNIATHFVGIPMIALAIAALLSRPAFLAVSGFPISPAVIVTLATVLFYVVLDVRYGLAMTVTMGLSLWAASWIAAQTTALWLTVSIGLFVVGWIIQFIGHYFEGKKPAFLDDLFGLIIGPLFVVAEAGFALGLRNDVRLEIEKTVGPTLIRVRPAKPAAASR
jgi:uncharacterized membrane protein YGL010W